MKTLNKQLWYILPGVLILTCLLIRHHRGDQSTQESMVPEKTYSTQDLKGEIKASRKIVLASSLSQDAQEDDGPPVDYIGALGKDLTGQTAFKVINSFFAEKMGLPYNGAPVCTRQANCPMNIQRFYEESFNRLSSVEFVYPKGFLQEAMVKSDLDSSIKVNILVNELISSKFSSVPSTTYQTDDGKMNLGLDSQYLLETENRLLSLNPDPKLAISATLSAIANSQSPQAQLSEAIALIRHYPNQVDPILNSLAPIGISPSVIRDIARTP